MNEVRSGREEHGSNTNLEPRITRMAQIARIINESLAHPCHPRNPYDLFFPFESWAFLLARHGSFPIGKWPLGPLDCRLLWGGFRPLPVTT